MFHMQALVLLILGAIVHTGMCVSIPPIGDAKNLPSPQGIPRNRVALARQDLVRIPKLIVERLPNATIAAIKQGTRSFAASAVFLIPISVILSIKPFYPHWNMALKQGIRNGIEWACVSSVFTSGETFCQMMRLKNDRLNKYFGSAISAVFSKRQHGAGGMLHGFVTGAAFMFMVDQFMAGSDPMSWSGLDSYSAGLRKGIKTGKVQLPPVAKSASAAATTATVTSSVASKAAATVRATSVANAAVKATAAQASKAAVSSATTAAAAAPSSLTTTMFLRRSTLLSPAASSSLTDHLKRAAGTAARHHP